MNEFLEQWISKHFHRGPVRLAVLLGELFSVNLDTSYEYSPVPLGDQAQIPGETRNLDHLTTLLTLFSELLLK